MELYGLEEEVVRVLHVAVGVLLAPFSPKISEMVAFFEKGKCSIVNIAPRKCREKSI